MRTAIAVVVSISAGALAASRLPAAAFGQGLMSIVHIWWLVPLGASLISMSVLAVSALSARQSQAGDGNRFPTGAYLVSGPAFGALTLGEIFSFGPAPPLWAGYLMLAVLLFSAWVYLRTQRPEE